MAVTITWLTPAGSIGVYPANVVMTYKLRAIASAGTITSYKIISGNLPAGVLFRDDGKIYGTPETVTENATTTFVVRVTANDGIKDYISDRTFQMSITGDATPRFTIPSGLEIINTEDSIWQEFPITYNNPIPSNPIAIRVLTGELPPGLEINEEGLIRGYPLPPITNVFYQETTTLATATDGTNNFITVLSTNNFKSNRPIIFSGTTLGGIVSSKVYYVKEVINATQITITTIPNGTELPVSSDTGFMDVTLPQIDVGEPSKAQYNFTLDLISPKGNDRANYTITVVNQNLPISQGGPGKTIGTRYPVIYNTRPPTYNISDDTVNYGYYVLPPAGFSKELANPSPPATYTLPGLTYNPNQFAYIGQFESDNLFTFHILGYDFDGQVLTYQFADLPEWCTGNTSNGWIYGDPSVSLDSIDEFSFSVRVLKVTGENVFQSDLYSFTFRIANNITDTITWITNSDLGTFYNSQICTKDIVAEADVPLYYELVTGSGDLPPNLTLSQNGELIGTIAYQPGDNYTPEQATETFTFSIRAYAQDDNLSDIITTTKTFTMTVAQEFSFPTDNLYIKCTPNSEDRYIISSLLTNTNIIPNEYLYRPDDSNFGKAQNVTYAHAYGIYSSNLEEYIAAVEKNHYWRNIILGSLSTAIARDDEGNILYEVVYSNIIDNLMKYDPNYGVDYRYAVSIDEEILWPRFIDLNLGPWYTSSTDIYTSFIFAQDAYLITDFREYTLLTQDGIPLLLNQGVPTFYTNLTPGYAKILYPNSLDNMRKRVEQELGFTDDFRKLPLWMTSQQRDGNTLGFTPAWVICYTKPSPTIEIFATQSLGDFDALVLSSVEGLSVGGEVLFTGSTFGNILSNEVYYIIQIGIIGNPNTIILSQTKGGAAYKLFSEVGTMNGTFSAGSYAEIIKDNIENEWPYKLNEIDFKIDRFTVDKAITYDFDTYADLNTWIEYPSATPVPDPADSQNFYVLFPRKTILPNKTQYKL